MSGLVVMRRTAIAVIAALGVSGYIGAANAATVDFSTLKDPPSSLTNYSQVPDGFGSSSEVEFKYSTIFANSTSAVFPYVLYWASGSYTYDQAAFAAYPGLRFQLVMEALGGQHLSSVSFLLGSNPDIDLPVTYEINNDVSNVLKSASSVSSAGLLLSLVDLNTKSITLRFGTDWNVGLREVRYETSTDDDDGGGDGDPSAVPVPAALPLLASGLGGFWLIRLRRRNEGVVG